MTRQFLPSVSVIGLGKLGGPIAAALAQRGFRTVGVDNDPRKVEMIGAGLPPIQEPGYEDLLTQTQGRLSTTTDLFHAVQQTDISLVVVPTPSDPDGTFSLRHLLPIMRQIGSALRQRTGYHLVVITSTVMPGDTGGPIRQTLELHAGKPVNQGWGLCYSPEFVALGSVIHDFLNPDLVLIGQSDARAGDVLETLATKAALTRPSVARLNFVNAELAKLAVNTYVTTKITYANTLAAICQQLPEADVDEVTRAIGLDSRIGSKYLRGGLAYGGPCFPRDNVALSALACQHGVEADLPEAVDRINRSWVDKLSRLVLSQLDAGERVAVLGMSYKPGSDVIEESIGVALARRLAERNVEVIVHDPAALQNAKLALNGSVQYAESIDQAVHRAGTLVLTTPWPQYVENLPGVLARTPGKRVIDGWRCLNAATMDGICEYVALGRGPQNIRTRDLSLSRVA